MSGYAPLTADQLAHINDSKVPTINGVDAVLMVLAFVAVAARFYARRIRKLPLKTDDWLMIPSLLSVWAVCICNIIGARHGFGKHAWATSSMSDVVILIKSNWAGAIVYVTSQFFIKLSILFLYARIFTLLDKTFKLALFATGVYVVAWSIAILFLTIFGCVPVNSIWNENVPGKCLEGIAVGTVPNILSVIADFAILLLPGIVLFKLHMTPSRKIGLMLLFLIGLLSCAAGLARLCLRYGQGLLIDPSWYYPDIYVWSAVEVAVGIVCACFPVVAPAFSGDKFKKSSKTTSMGRLINKIFGGSSKGSSGMNNSPNYNGPNMTFKPWPSSNKSKNSHKSNPESRSDSGQTLPTYSAADVSKDHTTTTRRPDEFNATPHAIHPMPSDRRLLRNDSEDLLPPRKIRDEEQGVPQSGFELKTTAQSGMDEEERPWTGYD